MRTRKVFIATVVSIGLTLGSISVASADETPTPTPAPTTVTTPVSTSSPVASTSPVATSPSQVPMTYEDQVAAYKVALVAYRVALKQYRAAWKETVAQYQKAQRTARSQFRMNQQAEKTNRDSINSIFHSAISKAQSDYKSAMKSATNVDQKTAAIATRKTAVSDAINARKIALDALGPQDAKFVKPVLPVKPPAPIKPTPPIKPAKPEAAAKSLKAKKSASSTTKKGSQSQ